MAINRWQPVTPVLAASAEGLNEMVLKDGSLENYEAAAIRHFSDSQRLSALGQMDNAGHLIGFAAECAIKYKIGAVGLDATPQHLPEMLTAARKRLGSRAKFVAMYNLIKADVLPGWAVDHRYSETGKVTADALEVWQQTTKRLLAAAGIKARLA